MKMKWFRILGDPCVPIMKCLGKKGKHNVWQLMEDFKLTFTHDNDLCSISVGKGFIYDGASIPPIAWSLLRLYPGGVNLLFSLTHDLLYRTSGFTTQLGQEGIAYGPSGKLTFSRKESDRIMRDIMVWHGVYTRAQVFKCFTAVSLFGRKYWGKEAPVW